MWNRKRTYGTSKYKGVHWYKQSKKWMVQIRLNDKQIYLGLFEREDDAARAYNKKAKEIFGEFACLNKIGKKNGKDNQS